MNSDVAILGAWIYLVLFVIMTLPTWRLSNRSLRLFPELVKFGDREKSRSALRNAFDENAARRLLANAVVLPILVLSLIWSHRVPGRPFGAIAMMAISGATTGVAVRWMVSRGIRASLRSQLEEPPKPICPHCGHELLSGDDDACAECGNEV